MKQIHCFYILLLFLFSCGRQHQSDEVTIVPSHTSGTLMDADTIELPDIVLAGDPKTFTTSNSFSAAVNQPLPHAHFTSYNVEQGLALNSVACAYYDKFGNMWFGTDGGGVSKYDGKSFTNFTTEHGLPNNTIWSILEDQLGNLWFGTNGGGVSKYDGKLFTNVTSDDGLANDVVLSIAEDRLGNLWFGTDGGGVSKYDGNRVESIERGISPGQKQDDLKKIDGKLVKSFTNFTTESNLANNSVWSIKEDKWGNMWFGTDGGGVSKYDGKSFNNYTTEDGLPNNVILSIGEDQAGNLWFGTDGGGVSKYDGNRVDAIERGDSLAMQMQQDLQSVNGKLRKTFTNFTKANGLAANVVLSIIEDKTGNLWFGTDGGGVSKYDGNRVEAIQRGDQVASQTQQDLKKSNGNLVKSFTNFTTDQGLANNVVLSIAEDNTGNLWFCTYGAGVSKYEGKSFTNFTTAQGLANNVAHSIVEDRHGKLWVGTDGGGVSIYDGNAFSNFNSAQGLANNNIRSIIEDDFGNLWFGTYGGGVSKYDGNLVSDLDKNFQQGQSKVSKRSLKKKDIKTFSNFSAAQGLPNNTIWCITQDRLGNLWFGTDGGGAAKYDGNRVEALQRGDKYALLFQADVKKVNGKPVKTFTNFSTDQGLAHNGVLCIIEDIKGNLWFGTDGGGVSRYSGNLILNSLSDTSQSDNSIKQSSLTASAFFTNFNTSHGLPNNVVSSICEDLSGNIWIGTENGLTCLCLSKKNGETGEAAVFEVKNYTIANGLPDNSVTQLLQLPGGLMAVGTKVGIAVFNPLRPLDINGKLSGLKVFNASTGYPIKDVNMGQNSMYLDSKGVIWAGTGQEKISLVRLDYNSVNYNLEPPVAVIQNIKIGEQDVCYYTLNSNNSKGTDTTLLSHQEMITYGKRLSNSERDSIKKQFEDVQFDAIGSFNPLPVNLTLPYNKNNVTIEYNCIEVSKHYMVNYQYMLEGYDKEWSPVLKKQEASYGNINEGTYTFKLRAQSPFGVWSEPILYSFTVLPPWYRTWWMYILYGISAVGSVVLIVRWNGRRLRLRAIELTEEVRKATREIVAQKKVVEEKHKEITDSINYAERIQRALLANAKLLDEHLNEYFILFKPKDVVSGDFYWATVLENNHFVLVAADSTGHGVPGAIMSILNIASLDKAVTKGILSPDLILNETRKLIIENLKNDGSEEGGKDGMDGSLLSFDLKNNMLYCASANNPIWIVRNSELIEIKGDRMPIGKHEKDHMPFTLHSVNLQKGDVVYVLTDGFAHQFGGAVGKKFKYRKLQEYLLSMSNEPMQVQKQKLNDAFDNWKGNLEQIDDVCVVGIKI